MKNKHQKLLSWYKAKGCTLNLKINLDRLFKKAKERERFDAKWKDFIASDPDNKKVAQGGIRKKVRNLDHEELFLLFYGRSSHLPYVVVPFS